MQEFKEWYAEVERLADISGMPRFLYIDDGKVDWRAAFEDGKTPTEALYIHYPDDYKPGDLNPTMYDKHIPMGSRWQHREGGYYTVLYLTNRYSSDHRRYPIYVVYEGDNGNRWTRPAADWDRSMTRVYTSKWRERWNEFWEIVIGMGA